MDDLRPLMDCWQEGQGSFIEKKEGSSGSNQMATLET